MSRGRRALPTSLRAAAALVALTIGTASSGKTDYLNKPDYEAFEVSRHEPPKTTFRFSAGNATAEWPIMITIPGRDIQPAEDNGERIRLQRFWVAEHVQQDARLVAMGSSECGPAKHGRWPPPLPEKSRFGICDTMIVDDPGRPARAYFYFYVENWPSLRDFKPETGKP